MRVCCSVCAESSALSDILVNNAGLQRNAPFDEMTLAQWRKKYRWPLAIICISSVHEVIPWSRHANYAASKGGIMMMMKSLAQEVAPLRIRVNSICPRGRSARPSIGRRGRRRWLTWRCSPTFPTGASANRRTSARVAVLLACDLADSITGASIFVDGGMTSPEFSTGG